MSTRPANWSPLAAADPVPGDPDGVDDLACRYRDTALEIERQSRLLRSLSAAHGWDSEAGTVFAEEAAELAGQLAKVQGRYQAVSRELRSWAPALRDAQSETLCALRDAQDADARIRANGASVAPRGPEPDPRQEAAEERRLRALDAAEDDLNAARRRAQNVVDRLDGEAQAVARAIRRASDDDVKDGLWDTFKNFIHDHAGFIKAIVIALQVLGAIVVVLALVLTMPAWLPMALALGALAALALNVMLAAAGEESWKTVALDVLFLAAGGVLGKAASRFTLTAMNSLRAAHGSAANVVGLSSRARFLASRGPAVKVFRFLRRLDLPLVAGWSARRLRGIYDGADEAAARAAARYLRTHTVTAPRTTIVQRHAELLDYARDANRLTRQFEGSREVVQHATRAADAARKAAAARGAHSVVEIADAIRNVHNSARDVAEYFTVQNRRFE